MAKVNPLDPELIPLTPLEGGRKSIQEITGKKPRTVLRWTKGVLPAIKIGGTWYTSREAFEEFCERCSAKRKRESEARSVASLVARIAGKK